MESDVESSAGQRAEGGLLVTKARAGNPPRIGGGHAVLQVERPAPAPQSSRLTTGQQPRAAGAGSSAAG